MKVETFQCNPFQEQCYVIWDETSKRCLVVDPGMCTDWEWERIHRFIQQKELTPDAVLITHNHSDHVMGTGYLTKAYPGLPVYGSMEDQNHLPTIPMQNRFFGVDAEVHYAPITRNLMDGDTLLFPMEAQDGIAQHRIEVLDCPGHSHHGLCYYFPDDLFHRTHGFRNGNGWQWPTAGQEHQFETDASSSRDQSVSRSWSDDDH